MAYREVYRGYSDEEFLSDPAALTDWGFSPVEHNSRERLLRRLAGMAALTGVMGGAVGAIAFAGVGSRSAGLRATASATPRPAATRPTSAPTRRAHRGGRPRASLRGRSHSAARAARSVRGRPTAVAPAKDLFTRDALGLAGQQRQRCTAGDHRLRPSHGPGSDAQRVRVRA